MNIYQLHNNTIQLKRQCFIMRIARTHNSGLAKVTVQCSSDTFPAKTGQVVVNQTMVLRINIRGENRYLRQASKRYKSCKNDITT